MKHYITILFLLTFNGCSAQTQLNRMILQLREADFEAVYRVKDSIVNYQKNAIPKLMELLKDTSFVKLQNTADLIYPGAEQYYGHGWIVNYDIDWIAVRAAWLLEEITFQDFGYRDLIITEAKLRALHKQNYTSYLQTGSHDIDFKDKTQRQRLIGYRLMLADSVSKWWNKNKNTWTRFSALKQALSANDEERQSVALHYLRFDKSTCDGLTLDSYKQELKPLVLNIKNSKNGEAEQAKLLLRENGHYWDRSKPKKSVKGSNGSPKGPCTPGNVDSQP